MVSEKLDGVMKSLSSFSSATLYEALGSKGALPSEIKPLFDHFRICGPALTVNSPPGDNLWLHKAIYESKPGDILVVTVGSFYEAGYWGEIMTRAALQRNIGGLVIDGCVRDGEMIRTLNFPVFARGLCIRSTKKDIHKKGETNTQIQINDVQIESGDIVVGDLDGVMIFPQSRIKEALKKAAEREEKEAEIAELIKEGESTLNIYKLDGEEK